MTDAGRAKRVRVGLASIGIGVDLTVGSLAILLGAEYVPRVTLLALLAGPSAIGYGAHHLFRAFRPEGPVILEKSDCWECADAIRSWQDGLLCEQCGHPVHTRCKSKHDKLLHAKSA